MNIFLSITKILMLVAMATTSFDKFSYVYYVCEVSC